MKIGAGPVRGKREGAAAHAAAWAPRACWRGQFGELVGDSGGQPRPGVPVAEFPSSGEQLDRLGHAPGDGGHMPGNITAHRRICGLWQFGCQRAGLIDIACRIVVVLHGKALDLGLKPFARFEPRIGPRHALRAVVVGG